MQCSDKLIEMFPMEEHSLFIMNQQVQESLLSEIKQTSNLEDKEWIDCFVSDGFYPYYTKQKIKILFIGKESLGIGGSDYIDILIDGILHNDPRGRAAWNREHPDDPYKKIITNNNDPFLSKILYITYGLNHDCPEWEDIPWASEIGTSRFANDGGISFAIMNFSKLDNPSEISYSADIVRMNKYCEFLFRTGKNWHEKQIGILNPDLVISMNLKHWFPYAFKCNYEDIWDVNLEVSFSNVVRLGHLPIEGKRIPIIDTFHFSAPGKRFMDFYYHPIIKACKEYFKLLE